MKFFHEGELKFGFPQDVDVLKLDEEGTVIPQGMSFVDFIVELDDKRYMIEVKDPFHTQATRESSKDFLKKLKTRELISKLVPKCRDSYTYLHLMEKDDKSIIFIVLIVLEPGSIYDNDLIPMKEHLFDNIQKEMDSPWKRKYINNCFILNLTLWKRLFNEFSIERIPEKTV